MQQKLKQIDKLKEKLKLSINNLSPPKKISEKLMKWNNELKKYKEATFNQQCRLDTELDRYQRKPSLIKIELQRELTDIKWENRDLNK